MCNTQFFVATVGIFSTLLAPALLFGVPRHVGGLSIAGLLAATALFCAK